jgi:hydrogenase maturation protease
MPTDVAATHTLILGIGNILLSDDGVGVHVIAALQARQNEGALGPAVALRDGGTISLELLTEIAESPDLIAVDAVEFNGAPGTVRVFEGAEMDKQLGGKKRTAHEVALADLMTAARLAGCEPKRRALVAIQPFSTQWGLAPSQSVQDAIPEACETVISLIRRWTDER